MHLRAIPQWLVLTSLVFMLSGCAATMDFFNKGPVRENRTERRFAVISNDESIENVTTVNIRKANLKLRQSHINVVCFNGVVLLLGQVPNEELRQKAAEVASNVKDVRQVNNALTTDPQTSGAVRMYDSWLTTKVKSKLLFTPDIDSDSIKVITENGVVYLMGLIRQRDAERVASIAQRTDGAQRIVKAFEYVD